MNHKEYYIVQLIYDKYRKLYYIIYIDNLESKKYGIKNAASIYVDNHLKHQNDKPPFDKHVFRQHKNAIAKYNELSLLKALLQ